MTSPPRPATRLDPGQLTQLRPGTPIAIQRRHNTPLRGRVQYVEADQITIQTAEGDEVTLPMTRMHAHVLAALLAPGDDVLRVGVPIATWRGTVIEVGRNPDTGNPGARVETFDATGGFTRRWYDETSLRLPPAIRETPGPHGRPRADAALMEAANFEP